jgi:hypothetical protein
VTDVFLSRNTHPSNSAGVPGISLPMAVNAEGLPLGLELDAAAGHDRDLLALARRVECVLGHVPRPPGTSRDLVYSPMPKGEGRHHADAINAGRRRFLGRLG